MQRGRRSMTAGVIGARHLPKCRCLLASMPVLSACLRARHRPPNAASLNSDQTSSRLTRRKVNAGRNPRRSTGTSPGGRRPALRRPSARRRHGRCTHDAHCGDPPDNRSRVRRCQGLSHKRCNWVLLFRVNLSYLVERIIRSGNAIVKAFSAAFHRLDQRCRPLPVGSRLMIARYTHLSAAASVGKCRRAGPRGWRGPGRAIHVNSPAFEVYVATDRGVEVLDGATNTVVGSITSPAAWDISAADGTARQLFVAERSGNLTRLS